ncbi:Uncharacterized protein Rs2_21625 [Raphanus sativus]|nr:Uncharacterized protein Rs2_21625 [Raphanus sativus]
MTDPYYADMKQHKKDNDWREWVWYVEHCIPKKCVCDAPITLETDDKGTSYYSCKYFKDDGLHIRHRCFDAIEEELQELKEKVAHESIMRRQVEEELKKMREEIKDVKKLLMLQTEKGSSSS